MAPITPVYDSRPPCSDAHEDEWIRPPRWPDVIVFGNVAAMPEHDLKGIALRGCRSCGVRGDGAFHCWNCGRVTGATA